MLRQLTSPGPVRPLIAGSLCVLLAAGAALYLALRDGGGVLSNGGGLFYGGIGATPGSVADFPLPVENSGSSPVILESAALIPVPGFPAPRLVHLGVLAEHFDLLTSDYGWPPWKGSSPSGGSWTVHPLRGYIVQPWAARQRRHMGPMPGMIEYGVTGTRPRTDYWAAGLRITYLYRGSRYTQSLYDGGADCAGYVDFSKPAAYGAFYRQYCAVIDRRANQEFQKMASG